MTQDYSPPYEDKLRGLYAALDRLAESERVTGYDAWAIERVTDAVEAALDDQRDAEADELVDAMAQAVAETQEVPVDG